MAWSYISTAPFSSSMSEIRLRIGDTTSSVAFLQDDEIFGVVDNTGGGTIMAAAVCADLVAASVARKVSITEGAFSASLQMQYQHYRSLAKRLRLEARTGTGLVYGGGISQADVGLVESESDRVVPGFKINQCDTDVST